MFGKVVIKKRVDTITADMIKNRKLKVCILPDSVKIIESKAFCGCSNLKEIIFVDEEENVVNNKIEEIRYAAFSNTSIEKFVYSHHLKIIGEAAFSYTPLSILEYRDDNYESGLKVIGPAFYDTKITDMVISPSVEKLTVYPKWKSLLCKDNNGNIVPFNRNLTLGGNYSNLEEISLLGVKNINSIIKELEKLKKIHLDIDSFQNKELQLPKKAYEFVLYGETEKLDWYTSCFFWKAVDTITFGSRVKIKEITDNFFSKIANESLVVPEGVEIIGKISNARLLKFLELPSTLKEIHGNNRFWSDMTVTIYKNLPLDSYENLCRLLIPKESKIIIKGDSFTVEEKEYFEVISPKGLTLEFMESKQQDLKKSINQDSIDDLSREIISLINLMPSDFKSIVQERYNKIIDDYRTNIMREEQTILDGKSFFGSEDSYFRLRGELLNFHAEIILNRQDIIELTKIEKYKQQVINLLTNMGLKNTMDVQNDSTDNIEKMIKSIYIKVAPFGKQLGRDVMSGIKEYLLEIENIYRNRIHHILDSSLPFSSGNLMSQLTEFLGKLLVTLDNPTMQEVMKLRASFFSKNGNVENIESLADNINLAYNAALKIPGLLSEWNKSLSCPYSDLLAEILIRAMNQENIVEDFNNVKQQLKNDLILFLDQAIIVSDNQCHKDSRKKEMEDFCQLSRDYRDRKIKEVHDSYQFFCDNNLDRKDIKHTVSSLLMKEIMKMNENLTCLFHSYPLQEIIKTKVDETIEQLNLTCDSKSIGNILKQYENDIDSLSKSHYPKEIVDQKLEDTMKLLIPICKRENVDDIMQQFYKCLTDIWAQVWELSSLHNSKVMLKKLR